MTDPRLRAKIERAKRLRLVPPRPDKKGKTVVTFIPKREGRRPAAERDARDS